MMSKVIAFEPIVNSLKLFNKLLTEKYLLGIGTLEFLKPAWPSALVGRPFNGVTECGTSVALIDKAAFPQNNPEFPRPGGSCRAGPGPPGAFDSDLEQTA